MLIRGLRLISARLGRLGLLIPWNIAARIELRWWRWLLTICRGSGLTSGRYRTRPMRTRRGSHRIRGLAWIPSNVVRLLRLRVILGGKGCVVALTVLLGSRSLRTTICIRLWRIGPIWIHWRLCSVGIHCLSQVGV